MLIVAAVCYGRPSAALVRRDIDRRFEPMVSEVLASRAQLVTGDYWTVWPTVFVANMKIYDSHESRSVYGLCYRSVETSPLWRNQPKLCVAAPRHDTDAGKLSTSIGRQFIATQISSTIEVFCER
jgi:hypothetical protein